MSCPYKPSAPPAAAQQDSSDDVPEDALVPIPQPPTHWFVGNLPEMNPSFPLSSIWRMADIYGDIYKVDLKTVTVVVISSYELINEVMDTSRFQKKPTGTLYELRSFLGDGLFTAFGDEENWGKAHRVLMPVFGPLAIRKMFPEMQDLISQMILRMDRMGPDNEIYPSDDFTRLAFDVIGLCGFGYRFNSFFRDEIHPFARQMAAALVEAGKRANRPALENHLRYKSAEEYRKNIQSMWELCDKLVAERKQNPQPDANDLLNTMLNITDPQTGEKLSDENIRLNCVTFLVAGHETTSGTLSFLFYQLLKNPETYHKAQEEVDRVLGNDVLRPEHLPRLKYIEACIRETLRVQGPISALNVLPLKDTVIGGKYRVSANESILCSVRGLHHDRRIWGDDADVFRPERLMDGNWEKLPPNAWKPFGNGERACIGRFFAEQEMLMAVAMILQRFQVSMVDPSYDLRLKATLTVKPDSGFKIRVARRQGRGLAVGIPDGLPVVDTAKENARAAAPNAAAAASAAKKEGSPLVILYGSNAGTCKYLAEDLEMAARDRGFSPVVKTMDEATEQLSKDVPVAVVTPTYEGKPADNARNFVAWLESGKARDNLQDVRYSVFGVGNSEWATTFFRIPKLVDELMPKLGAHRIIPAKFVDVNQDLVGPWEDWRDEFLSSLSSSSGSTQAAPTSVPELEVTVEQPQIADLLAGEKLSTGIVRENRQIAGAEVGSAKRHIEIELPEGITYEPGGMFFCDGQKLSSEVCR
ncbi:cytochrome P450 [Xylariaceae sp. FL0594]|nr:cytochrome P450 [Xylariaceae sp. FL0594]